MVSSSMDLYSCIEQTEQNVCSHMLQLLQQRRHRSFSQKLHVVVNPSDIRLQHRLVWDRDCWLDDLVSFPWELMHNWIPRALGSGVLDSSTTLTGEGSPLLQHIMGVSLPLMEPSGGKGERQRDGGDVSRDGLGVCSEEIFSRSPSTNCLVAPARRRERVRSYISFMKRGSPRCRGLTCVFICIGAKVTSPSTSSNFRFGIFNRYHASRMI